MKKLFAILSVVLFANQARAEFRTFICKDDPLPSFNIYIDVDAKIMRTNSWGEVQHTMFFTDRYIMNFNFVGPDNIGGSTIIFDRYTGELVFDVTNIRAFKTRKSGFAVTESVWTCNEKKI